MVKNLESNIALPSSAAEREIVSLGPWFHNLHLPDGRQTAPSHPLGDFPNSHWQLIRPYLPVDLSGWSVLDIGCNAGFYCFELAKLGARVTGVDIESRYLEQAAWAARIFGLQDRISFVQGQVYELPATTFDLVLFMGVFYHLRYPLLGLDRVRMVTGKLLLFQTLAYSLDIEEQECPDLELGARSVLTQDYWPKMAFIEDRLQGDPSNWWVPNGTAIKALLRSARFRIKHKISDEIVLCEPTAHS
ncbi:MAG: DUF1698 domain-containing protein [Bdellovibrionales bacterium]|nr:DUF1698 domain-containing protein [Bdellovibrionales bacterium]